MVQTPYKLVSVAVVLSLLVFGSNSVFAATSKKVVQQKTTKGQPKVLSETDNMLETGSDTVQKPKPKPKLKPKKPAAQGENLEKTGTGTPKALKPKKSRAKDDVQATDKEKAAVTTDTESAKKEAAICRKKAEDAYKSAVKEITVTYKKALKEANTKEQRQTAFKNRANSLKQASKTRDTAKDGCSSATNPN